MSLGKLGIITSLKFQIVKEQPVLRTLTPGVSPVAFLDKISSAQEMFKRKGRLPSWMNESQVFWVVQRHEVTNAMLGRNRVFPAVIYVFQCRHSPLCSGS